MSHKIKRKRQTKDRLPANYVDNEKFLEEIIRYKKAIKKNGGVKVPVTNDLATYFFTIAKNLASKGNFISYSFKEDMIADGVENCIRYASNFNPKISKNPFCYFTQIISWAFVRKIKKEKKQLYVRYKSFLESDLSEDEEILTMMRENDNLKDCKREFVQKFEESLAKKKKVKKKKTKSIIDFFL